MHVQPVHGGIDSAMFESTANHTNDLLTSPYNFFDPNSLLV